MLPFGDVIVRGSWSPPDASGQQQLRATLSTKPPKQEERLRALCAPRTSGSVTMQRSYDANRGLVAAFDGELDLVVEEGPRTFRRIVVVDRWRLVAVRDHRDFDFRKRVAAAIKSGAAWVRTAVGEEKSFLTDRRGERNYGSGRLALALLTLLHGHVPAADTIVQQGFARLRRRRLDDAYSLAAALMAIAALHERVPLTERDRAVAQKWLDRLLQCRDPRTDASELLRFNYTRAPRFDTSLQQYGLLGLRAAQRCRLVVPKGVFAAAVRHLLAVQGRGSGSLQLRLTTHAEVRRAQGTETPPRGKKRGARIRGFAYRHPEESAFGSMTSAGVSGLLLARAGLAVEGAADRRLLRQLDAAIRDGFAWLAQNFSVRINPGCPERADNHYAYWLYCLERCCELHRVAWLQGRDWYYEGALQLLSAQQPSGAFRASHASTLRLDSTCFAVLFLAKASAPAPITGR